jgi:unspecific monooxygenase
MQLPPSSEIPRFIQRLQWVSNPLQLMETSAKIHGDIFALELTNPEPIVFISNPQGIQEVFTTPPDYFDVGRSNKLIKPLVGDNSLLLIDGATHQYQRRLLTPPFHGERMKAYAQIITNITKQVISNWQLGQPFSVRDSMQEISLQVILQAVFGLCEGERLTKLRKLVASLLNLSGSPLHSAITFFPALQVDLGAWSPWGKFLREREKIYQILYTEIQERRNNPDSSRTDILSLMMSAQDENGEGMTDIELRDELMTLLLAGHETTASALTWALYWVHNLPTVRQKLINELNSITENTELNEIYRLPYLTTVCQETLRIYPIVIITLPRIVKTPTKIMGYEFAPGTLLAPCIYLTHRRPDLYPEPEKFKPERFLERQYSQYEYLPFGGGNRICIGMAFAMFEMKLVLATVLSQLDLELVDNIPVKPMRRGVTLAPSGGKWLIVTGKSEKVKIVVGV